MLANGAPAVRVTALNTAEINSKGSFVLYWMISSRRRFHNFGLQEAAARARDLNRPLVVLEALRVGYPHASRRLHSFIIEGMACNQKVFHNSGALYYPYVEPVPGAGSGLLENLAARACLVVTDWFPCFFLPRMLDAAAGKLHILLLAVDSCGMLPLESSLREFQTAYAFRRFVQKSFLDSWPAMALADPLEQGLPSGSESLLTDISRRWPRVASGDLERAASLLGRLPIDQKIREVTCEGGTDQAQAALDDFLNRGLADYHLNQRQPLSASASGLSPYLHFGHISTQEIFLAVTKMHEWHPTLLLGPARGQREGFWGLPPGPEAFLDQLLIWRELGFHYCEHRSDYDRYESLPAWALETLEAHARDSRPYLYKSEDFLEARTHDQVWNAAQTELLTTGKLHNYLRMLWAKKILEWSPHPKQALETMLFLNNSLALDGRDPNSYSGIFWCLGRFDRAWGPERPIFGKVRYMSSQNTMRKLNLKEYFALYGETKTK